MLEIDKAVIVEGKYDKIKLSSIIKGVIICTDGFRIFKDKEKMQIIRHYASTKGIIILTDSDSAGFKIRRHIKGAVGNIPEGNLINVYIPDIFGKERRKKQPSKEGKLGVEGVSAEVIKEAFDRAGVTSSERPCTDERIDKMLLYELGYSGISNSSDRRKQLLRHLGLPELMTTGALADILDTMLTPDELISITLQLFPETAAPPNNN
ncbi:MAG: toprim domain-containing protein [Huintestinicola sp.]